MTNPYFSETRNVELSTIYYLESEIQSGWDNITVVKTYPNFEKVSVPVVSIRLLSIPLSQRKEIGSRTLIHTYTITVDIFAKSDGQRIDIADFVMTKLSDNWTYYLHSHTSGDPGSLDRVSNGKIFWEAFVENTKVDFGETAEVYDKFRHSITVNVKLEKNA